MDEVNSNGGLLGRLIKLVLLDNQSTPIGSARAAEEAVRLQVTAVIGAHRTSHSLPIAEVAQARHIPMISNFSTSPKVTKTGNYIFRVCFTDDFQGVALARFAHYDLKAETASVFVHLNSEYSIGLSQIFRTSFEELGGKVVYEAEYKSKQKHFDAQIQRARKVKLAFSFYPVMMKPVGSPNWHRMKAFDPSPLEETGGPIRAFSIEAKSS